MSIEIVVRNPFIEPQTVALGDEPITIGRAVDCTVPVPDRFLSRKHLEIRKKDGVCFVVDCQSVNGTWLNGEQVRSEVRLGEGDRIRAGETEIVLHADRVTDRITEVMVDRIATISLPVSSIAETPREIESLISRKSVERLVTLNALATELLADYDDEGSFESVAEKILLHAGASRAAIAFIDDSGAVTRSVVARSTETDDEELTISTVLLREVISKREAVAYVDVENEGPVDTSHSLADQGVRSVLCAPIVIDDSVRGVLYIDYLLSQTDITEEEVRLVAQIAGYLALRIETSELRRKALQMRLVDEELRTARLMQQSLLPALLPETETHSFHAAQRPARAVGGDFYDVVESEGGELYFVVADVAGKGLTAAMVVAGLQASFRLLAREGVGAVELVSRLNRLLLESTPASTFVTLVAGVVDPRLAGISFVNAGHPHPVRLGSGAESVGDTDLLLGVVDDPEYREQIVRLDEGEVLALFTDGLAEPGSGDPVHSAPLEHLRAGLSEGDDSDELASRVVEEISPVDGNPDDVTLLLVHRKD